MMMRNNDCKFEQRGFQHVGMGSDAFELWNRLPRAAVDLRSRGFSRPSWRKL